MISRGCDPYVRRSGITEDRYHLVETEMALKESQACPYSVAFKLRKIAAVRNLSIGMRQGVHEISVAAPPR